MTSIESGPVAFDLSEDQQSIRQAVDDGMKRFAAAARPPLPRCT
ncbi:MAG TPA: hypothetical protein VFA63_14355 [Pseudonocardiaceae bacterium]|jgi:hypothetical protein|nr:hypothetical protein [Pseudonocardiaceae bacterium]